MNVFLTGGTGFLGAPITAELLRRGWRVTLPTRRAREVGECPVFAGAQVVGCDLDQVVDLDHMLGAHQALIHHQLIWPEASREHEWLDAQLCSRIFDAAGKAGVEHVVYTSSTAVHRPFRGLMRETDRLAPDDFYGAAKAAGELALWVMAHRHGFRATVIRVGPAIGVPLWSGARPTRHASLQAMIDAARVGEDLVVRRGTERQFVDAADVGRVFAAALEAEGEQETYLCVAEETTPWAHIAETIVAEIGSSSRVIVAGAMDAETPRFDTARLADGLGLRLTTRGRWPAAIRALLSE